MTDAKPSVWSRPVTFLVVTVWAIVVAAFFEKWASTIDGEPFRPAYAIGVLIVPYALGVVATLVSALVALVSRKQVQLLADFNFSVAVVLAILSMGLLDLTFSLF